jgi:hypothetical protein
MAQLTWLSGSAAFAGRGISGVDSDMGSTREHSEQMLAKKGSLEIWIGEQGVSREVGVDESVRL